MPDLPVRPGPRPTTSTGIPHTQLDQQPAFSRTDAILDAALQSFAGVHEAPSRISVPGARALLVDDQSAQGPAEAFLIGHEFAHVHPGPDHSLHLTLPPELAGQAHASGWGEPHVLVASGALPATVVMIYAPRDDLESNVVSTLLHASYFYATRP